MSQPKLSPTRRLLLWGALLAALSLIDLTLTTIALAGVDGATELNPVARIAFDDGPITALVLKLNAIVIVLCAALGLAPTPFARTTEFVLAGWCVIFLLVNAFSSLQLLGVI